MKTRVVGFFLFMAIATSHGQTIEDLFRKSDVEITWLGVDFSHVKLIGDFSQFAGVGEKSDRQIKRVYFPAWNHLILDEPEKYDIKGMMRKEEINIDIEMIMAINSKTDVSKLESYNAPRYTSDSIARFVSDYDLPQKTGISLVMIASSLNKGSEVAYFHFVAIRNSDKKILLQEKLKGKPGGIGLKNYWAGSIARIIIDIKENKYKKWKAEYLN
jgi:hypothetical protein